ncbi:hypothetical protein LCGC14_0984080 [marine sediment metagenome]|uniref:Uncharacterized protein n=1 Tax=marine sediment metagenome TaxID=412755 RepID=A0A0F9QR18_9ZZZZ
MLKYSNAAFEIAGLSTYNLTADIGESFLIRKITVFAPSDDGYLVLRVDRKTVGVYRTKGKSGNHLGHPQTGWLHKNLMESLTRHNINVSIPVAEGQTFTYEFTTGNGHVCSYYDVYDAGDIRADMPNGSAAKEYTFIQYMNAGTYPSASGDVLLNTSLSPTEFPDFPCGKSVPPRHKIDVLGVVGCPVGDSTDGNNYIVTDFVKLIKEREVLFDQRRRGFLFTGLRGVVSGTYWNNTFSPIGGCVPVKIELYDQDSTQPSYQEPLIFDEPIHCIGGEELQVYITARLVGSHTLTAGAIDLAAILRVVVE